MTCYHPVDAYITPGVDAVTGARRLSFRFKLGYTRTQVPCGKCVGCKLDYGRDWAVRCHHESKFHEVSIFATFTYDAEHLPQYGSLRYEDFRDFLKRLRIHMVRDALKRDPDLPRDKHPRLRYFHCGEYGERNLRPHYHALLFGLDFSDRRPLDTTPGFESYTSPTLSKLWGLGLCTFSPLSYQNASYAARYAAKKVVGASRLFHALDPATGELRVLEPEYATMSTKPGLGARWIDKYTTDAYPDDFVVIDGGPKGKPPRYYLNRIASKNPELVEEVKAARLERAKRPKHQANSTRARLLVREEVAKARINLRKRDL